MKYNIPITQELIDTEFANVVLTGTKEEIAFYAQFVSNPNIPDKRHGRLPIWIAIEGEDAYDKTKIVLSLNPDINVKNQNGQTPVMVALEKRMSGIGVLLLKHPTLDITTTDNQKDGLMKYAVLSCSPKAVIEAAKRGVPLDTPDIFGHIPAYYCVKNEDLDVFKALCLSGLKRDKNNPAYLEVMHLAQELAQSEQTLTWIHATHHGIFNDTKLNIVTQDWNTLKKRIGRLSPNNCFKVNNMLGINLNDADVCPPQNIYQTPQKLLTDALIEQCRYGTPENVALLLSIGANPNTRDKMGRTPLFCAISYHGQTEKKQTSAQIIENAHKKVQLLLENGANPNLPNLISNQNKIIADITPLEQSLLENRAGICALLIKNGANILQNPTRQSLISLAAGYCKSQLIDILAYAGASLTTPDQNGILPLEHAISNNKPYNVAVLRNHLTAQGHYNLFDITTPQGKKFHKMAQEQGEIMCEAMAGTLTRPITKQTHDQSPQTLDEKIASLSPQKLKLLTTLVGLNHLYQEKQHAASLPDTNMSPPAKRWTPFRMALAAFKREYRKKR